MSLESFYFKSLTSQPADNDSITVYVAGTTDLVANITTLAGDPLANPFLVSDAGGSGSWGFVAPESVVYDVYWVEGAEYITKQQATTTLLTDDQNAAIDAADTPSSDNPIATIKDIIEAPLSAGMLDDPGYTDNGDGTINVGAGQANLFSLSDYSGGLRVYDIPAASNLPLADLTTTYVGASYNGGSPAYVVTTDVESLDWATMVPVYTINRNGLIINVLPWDGGGIGLVNKLHKRLVKTDRFAYETGLMLSETTANQFATTAGRVWIGGLQIDLDAFDSSVDALRVFYHSGGAWTSEPATTYDFTHYDDGTDRQELSANRYAVNWVFRNVVDGSRAGIVLGSGDYTEPQAYAATMPPLPELMVRQGVLVGKIIVQKNAATADAVLSAFDQEIGANVTVVEHNDTAGIQGGEVGEYYHLTGTAADRAEAMTAMTEPTGFDRMNPETMGELTVDPVTKTITLAPAAGQTEFVVYVQGVKCVMTEPVSLTVPSPSDGPHMVYFDENCNLLETDSPGQDHFTKYAIVAFFYYNAGSDEILFGRDERHGIVMDGATHYLHHYEVGTVYVSGMTPDITVGASTLGAGGVTAGVGYDEDIVFTTQTTYTLPVIYQDSTGWRKTPASADLSVEYLTTGRPAYNEYTGTEWIQSDVGNNNYCLMHIVCTSGFEQGYAIVQGQNVYTTKSAATEGVLQEVFDLNTEGMPMPELLWVASYIVDSNRQVYATESGAAFVDLRYSTRQTISAGVVPSDHAQLLGLQGGVAGEYYHLTQTAASLAESATAAYTAEEAAKLAGIESLAEVNNISDVDATDLTDGGDSTLHYHAADRARANHTGTQTASTISDFLTAVQGAETVTSLSINANILTYTDEDGGATDIDLSLYLDDTNLARLVSGTLDGVTGIATFTRDDATTFTVDFSALLDDTQVTVVDNLLSTATDEALSANQGRVLGEALTAHVGDTDNPHSVTAAQLGVEEGAEVNNISDADATDLTDEGDTTLHYHAADRARANHTGTQTASTISDFDVEVANNTDVAANTAARHTHDNKATLDSITAAYTAEDATKLAGIEVGATADQTGAEIVSAIDTELGSTDWKTSGGGGGAGQTETTITQVAHGFSVLDVVRSSAGTWTEALADDTATLGLGLVVGVEDADTFDVAMGGFYEITSHGLTVDEYYYLSATTAGALTATEPDISQPVLYVVDANNVVVLPYRPVDTSAVSGGSGWDYTSASNPTVSTNPETYPVTWLNTTTGEEFICTDNTTDSNVWIGDKGSVINDLPSDLLEFYVHEFEPSFGRDISGNMFDFTSLASGRRAVMSNGMVGYYMSGGASVGIEAAGSTLTLPSDMSLSVWVELESVDDTYAVPICLGDSSVWVVVFINQSGRTITFGCDDNVTARLGTTSEAIPLYTPTHICLVLDFTTNGKAYLYINAVKSATEVTISAIASSSSSHGIRVGGRYGATADGFWGITAKPRKYARAITQAEVSSLYAEGV